MADGSFHTATATTAPPREEQALLGAILLTPDLLDRVTELLKPADFASSQHATIFAAMLKLRVDAVPLDIVTLAHALRTGGALAAVGDLGYLGELSDAGATSTHALDYARLVLDGSRRREAARIGRRLAVLESAGDTAAIGAAAEALQALTLAQQGAKLIPLFDTLTATFQRLEQAAERPQARATGFHRLDGMLNGGLRAGEVMIIAARPGVGKTSLALRLAVGLCAHGPVAFFSLEMTSEELTQRLLACEGRVNYGRIRAGALTQGDMVQLNRTAAKVANLPLLIDDSPGLRLGALRSRALAVHAKTPLAAVVVDYLQLVTVEGRFDRREVVGEVSRGLKGLAKELRCPVIALCQMNRESEKRGGEPKLTDLREAGDIEQDADIVSFIVREEGAAEGELLLKKHRAGPTGGMPLRYRGEFVRFEEKADDGDERPMPAMDDDERKDW